MSYLFFSSGRLNIDTVLTGFIIIALLASLALIAVSYLMADGNLNSLLIQASGIGRATLSLAESMAARAVPLITTATSQVGTLAVRGLGVIESFSVAVGSKLLSGLSTLGQLLENVLTVILSKIAAWGTYVAGQLASLLSTAIRAAANAAKDFLLKFVELVKGFFIPVI